MIEFIKSKYKIILVILGVVALLGICSLIFGNSNNVPKTNEHIVGKSEIFSTINSTGNISGNEVRNLTFGSTGLVGEIFADSGTTIKKGDSIASLDQRPFIAQVKMAEGDVQATNANLAKVKDRSQVTIQEKNLEILKIDNELAKEQLSRNIQIADNTAERASLQLDIAQINLDYAEDDETAQTLEISDATIDLQSTISVQAENLAIEQKDLTEIQLDKNLEIQEILTDQASLDYRNAYLSSENTKDNLETSLDKLQKQMEIAQIQLGQIQTSNQNDINGLSGQLARSQGNLEIARYNLEQSTIKAPFDGTVLSVPFKVGEQYSPSGPSSSVLFADLSNWKVVVNVNELDIGFIKIDQKVIIEVDGLFGTTFEGKVSKINYGPSNVDGLVTYQVEISFQKPEDANIFIGMTASVDFVTEEKIGVLTVPLVAIQSNGDKKFVTVKKDGNEVLTEITIGIQGESEVEVLTGLNEGDVVVY